MTADRRQFAKTALGSLVAYGFLETCWANNLFAETVKPTIHPRRNSLQSWFAES